MSKEFKIGLAVTSAIFMLYWGANFLTGNNIFEDESAFYVKYENLDGLSSSSGVNFRGSQVGSVKEIVFDSTAQDNYFWVVKFDIKTEGVRLMDSTIVSISSADLLGTMVISLSGINKGTKLVQPGDTLIGVLSQSLEDKVDKRLKPLQNKVNELVSRTDTLIQTFVTVMDDQTQNNLKRSFEQIPAAVQRILNTVTSLDTITSELKDAKLRRIIDNVESLTKALKNNSDHITNIITNLDNITDSLAKADVKQTLDRVNNVLGETETVMNKINRGEGTVGMLLNDKQLYEHLVLATADLDFLLMDIKQNPGRYINVSLMNFGTKRKKPIEARDTAEYEKFFKDAALKAGLYDVFKDEISQRIAKDITDSCGSPCDSVKMQQILKKYSK